MRALMCLMVALSTVTSAGAAADARAATVSVSSKPLDFRVLVTVTAAPGEVNDMEVAWEERGFTDASVVVADSGAGLVAGAGCGSVAGGLVRCTPVLTPMRDLVHVHAQLRDGDDQLRVAPAAGGTIGSGTLFVHGGAGDDRLDARNAFMARLDGGGGRDHLVGARFDTFFTDGDRDGATGGAAPGPDVFEGGPLGEDTLSYQHRTRPVRVDLADDLPEGAPGERDQATGIDHIEGGASADRLGGDNGDNLIAGGPGRDRITGRRGRDGIGGINAAWPASWPGEDPPRHSAAGDIVKCGRQFDSVDHPGASDFVPADCEFVLVDRKSSRNRLMGMPAYPEVKRDRVRYSFKCRSNESAFPRCLGDIRLLASDGATLASGSVTTGRRFVDTRLRLTPLGRALAGRPAGVRATFAFRGRNLPSEGWMIRLRTRGGRA